MFDAVITGAGSASGIGFAIARRLARAGQRVALCATTGRIHERVAELVEAGGVAQGFIADLTTLPAALRLALEVGTVKCLVNNAGLGSQQSPAIQKAFHDYEENDWDQTIATSLKTAFTSTRAFLPAMLSAGYGRIVNVTSVTGPYVSMEKAAAYSAAKAGMAGLTRALAVEYGPAGINVTAVAPGWIATAAASPADLLAGRATPLGRPGTPDEVAAAVEFLLSTGASYVNGETLVVDGGNIVQENKRA